MRRLLGVVAAGLLVAGCSTPPAHDTTAPPAPAKRLSLSACDEATPTGKVERIGYGLRFTRGSMQIKVRDAGGEQCVGFARWGNPDVEVPPDTLMYLFSGGRGEGAQIEFLGVDLAGGKLPDTKPLGPLRHPIRATVGVSMSGAYYTSSTCSLTLTASNSRRAAGRFDCPQAFAQAANPFNPSDDVSYEEPTTVPPAPRTAVVSGLFDVT